MKTSCNLSSTPFLGFSDSTRLQMSSKQLGQTITHPRCQIPKVIGNNFHYLSDSSKLFQGVAPLSGEIVYSNDDLMIVIFNKSKPIIQIFEIPSVMFCSEIYASKLRYKRDLGKFNVGDLLYEYDCFKHSLPSFGYNFNTAYMPFAGLNHEDALVVSETVTKTCCSTKIEIVLIPIYTYSLFKIMYDNCHDYGFMPGIGRGIKKNIIAKESRLKASHNAIQTLKMMNLTNFTSVIDNELKFNSIPIISRLNNAKVSDIRIHRIDKNIKLIDKNLQKYISQISHDYAIRVRDIYESLSQIFNQEYIRQIISQNYMLLDSIARYKIQLKDLAYLIEIKLISEDLSHIGDKLANRYANKGIISLVLPDELRPYTVKNKIPIDVITGPISVYSRMNIGQILEGITNKIITKSETEILAHQNDSNFISNELNKLSKISDLFNDNEYSLLIKELANDIRNNTTKREQFIASIRDLGLYLEAPNFTNFELKNLLNLAKQDFDIEPNEDIIMPRKTLKFLKQKLDCDIDLPANDLIIRNIFTAPIYTLKLKQEAKLRLSARDFGSYKVTSKQPTQGRGSGTMISQASRLGYMEFDALLSHGALQTVKEFRTVKSDSHNLKHDLALQFITSGKYKLPETHSTQSFTKMLIKSYIDFLNA